MFEDSPHRYPEFTLSEAAAHRPEIILLPTEPYHFTEEDKAGFLEMGQDVPAIRDAHIHIVEGELLSWYGPRLARALREISAMLHPAPRA